MKISSLFFDRDLLFNVDADLTKRAAACGVRLSPWPTKPLKPDRRSFAGDQQYERAMKRFARDMTKYHSQLTVAGQERKKSVDLLFPRQPTPHSWRELAERLWADSWLEQFLRNQAKGCGARDELTCAAIVGCVRLKLYFLILSNCGKWAREMRPAGNWRGWLIRQAPKLTQRSAQDELPPAREQPVGGDLPYTANLLDYLAQVREPPPEERAAVREAIRRQVQELPLADQEFYQAVYVERQEKSKLAAKLRMTLKQLDAKNRRLETKLLSRLKEWFRQKDGDGGLTSAG